MSDISDDIIVVGDPSRVKEVSRNTQNLLSHLDLLYENYPSLRFFLYKFARKRTVILRNDSIPCAFMVWRPRVGSLLEQQHLFVLRED